MTAAITATNGSVYEQHQDLFKASAQAVNGAVETDGVLGSASDAIMIMTVLTTAMKKTVPAIMVNGAVVSALNAYPFNIGAMAMQTVAMVPMSGIVQDEMVSRHTQQSQVRVLSSELPSSQ